MDVRKIVNSLIEDIANGTSINQILLKAQIVAFNIDDKRFSQLIKNEQQGYSAKDEIPDYRKQKTMVKATFVDSFQNVQTVEVHSEAIEDERIRDLMTFVFVREPLILVENMYKNSDSAMVRVPVPVFAYPTIKSLYEGYNVGVYSAYHCFPKESLLAIVETFKAQLMDLLLQFDKKLNWNVDLADEKNKAMVQSIINNVYHIHAVVANTGEGCVNTNDIRLKKLPK